MAAELQMGEICPDRRTGQDLRNNFQLHFCLSYLLKVVLRPFLYQVTTWQVCSSGFSNEKIELSFPGPFISFVEF